MTYSGERNDDWLDMKKYIFFKNKPQYKVDMSTCEMWFRKCQIIDGPKVMWTTVIHRCDGPAVISKNSNYIKWIWVDYGIPLESWLEEVKNNEYLYDDTTLALLYLKYL